MWNNSRAREELKLEKYPVKYYFMCPKTGIEMKFTKSEQWGWAVGFTNVSLADSLLRKDIHIPWPKLSEEEQIQVDANYENLHKMILEDDRNWEEDEDGEEGAEER